MAVVEQLQALVGGASGHSAAPREPVAARRTRRATPAAVLQPVPVLAGSTARRGSQFPLDDSEFKEF